MRHLVRRHLRFFLLATAAAFALRLLFLWKLSFVAGDSLIYGDIAKNWLQHGTFALTEDGIPVPTDIRLAGYPAMLALIWKVVGLEHYTAVMEVQMFLDVGTCYITAALANKVLGERPALAAFLLYALNPFTTNYVATPLAEVPAIFFSALVLFFAVEGMERLEAGALRAWAYCGLALAAGILMRPDGGILLAAISAYLLVQFFLRAYKRRIAVAEALLVLSSLAPLVPWTVRNLRVLHVFQPLAPRYATNPWEFVPAGFNRWIKTWLADYVSVDDIYWHVPGDPIDINSLPLRAFDSPQERVQTEQIFATYNAACDPVCRIAPVLDGEFARLADERIHHSPVRYYVWLPVLRVADMWLRPRTESLPLDSHWWRFRRDPRDAVISVLLGAVNLAYIVAAIAGGIRKRVAYAGLFILWVAMRCVFLATLENPEPRYTLECFPAVFVFAAANFASRQRWSRPSGLY